MGALTLDIYSEKHCSLLSTAARNVPADSRSRFRIGNIFPSDSGRLLKDLLLNKQRTHSERVCLISLLLVKRLREPALNSFDVFTGALFHDIGKLKIPLQILSKRRALTSAEQQIMTMHCQFGQTMLDVIPLLRKAGQIVLAHHERFDGLGYPSGLKEQQIPLGARIVAIADSFDAMTCNRPYQGRLDVAVAREEIITHSGQQFDPRLVDVFAQIPLSTLAAIAEDEEMS